MNAPALTGLTSIGNLGFGILNRIPHGLSAHLLDALLAGDRLARALAGPRVGPGPLAADRQALAMSHPAIAADLAQTRDILLDLPAELPFHGEFIVQERGQLGQVVLAHL